MRRAGCEVWSAYDLDGSYEETPPHLLASLQRDRRWCHGNLQHLWFLFAPGLTLPSRVNILIGIMAYVGSPLWLLFLLLSPLLFIGGNSTAASGLLFVYVLGLLLVPKLLGALQMISAGQLETIGGRLKIFRDVTRRNHPLDDSGPDSDVVLHAVCLVLFFRRRSGMGPSKTRG